MLSTSVLTVAVLHAVSAAAQCYSRSDGKIISEGSSGGWTVCEGSSNGGAQLCCQFGSECGADSICRAPTSSAQEFTYYVGGCTDSSYNDPICRKDCSTTYNETYIQWDSSTNLWQCCGNDECTGSPTDETFSANSPSSFALIASTTSGAATTTSTGAGSSATSAKSAATTTTTAATGSTSSSTLGSSSTTAAGSSTSTLTKISSTGATAQTGNGAAPTAATGFGVLGLVGLAALAL